MKTTEHLGLKKPEPADFYNVQDFNDNTDTIDREFATLISDETINAFALEGIGITNGNSGGGSSGDDAVIDDGDVATDEEVEDVINNIFK